MTPIHDDDHPQTEAGRTSETRFGPRPVPAGHHVPHGMAQSRRVIPSGRVSPDGRAAYPNPSTAGKIAVWGGIGLGVAGGTAAAVLAIRKLAEALSDDERSATSARRRRSAPRFAALDDHEQEAMHSRVRKQDRNDRQQAARLRIEASQTRSAPQGKVKKTNFAESMIETSDRLADSLNRLATSMGVAVESFRGVASQATGIVQEFVGTAEQLRTVLRGDQVPQSPRSDGDDDRTHRL